MSAVRPSALLLLPLSTVAPLPSATALPAPLATVLPAPVASSGGYAPEKCTAKGFVHFQAQTHCRRKPTYKRTSRSATCASGMGSPACDRSPDSAEVRPCFDSKEIEPSTFRRSLIILAAPFPLWGALTSSAAALSSSAFESLAEEKREQRESRGQKERGGGGEGSPGAPTLLAKGVQLVTFREGSGASPGSGDVAVVHYTARLAAKQGWRFDSTLDHKDEYGGPDPFEFVVGSPRVIQGLSLAVQSMKVGSIARAIIPPNASYMTTEDEPLPPNFFDRQRLFTTVFNPTRLANGEADTLGTVIFDLQLLAVRSPLPELKVAAQ